MEVAARYATFEPGIPGTTTTEVGGALNYFVQQAHPQVQADFRQLENEGRGTRTKSSAYQTQVIF